MKKILVISAIILFCAVSGYSKAGFKIGLGAGVNVCKIKDKYYSDINDRMVAYDVSIPMEIKVSKYFAIQPEVHFIQKGFSLKYYGINDISKIFRRRDYIEMPVNFKVIFPIRDKSFVNAYIGVGAGYALSNRQITKYENGDRKTDKFPYDNNVDDDNIAYRRFDIILPIGFGYEYRLNNKISIFADLRWSLDVNNNIRYKVKPDPMPRYMYRNFIFSIGLNFIAKDK